MKQSHQVILKTKNMHTDKHNFFIEHDKFVTCLDQHAWTHLVVMLSCTIKLANTPQVYAEA